MKKVNEEDPARVAFDMKRGPMCVETNCFLFLFFVVLFCCFVVLLVFSCFGVCLFAVVVVVFLTDGLLIRHHTHTHTHTPPPNSYGERWLSASDASHSAAPATDQEPDLPSLFPETIKRMPKPH